MENSDIVRDNTRRILVEEMRSGNVPQDLSERILKVLDGKDEKIRLLVRENRSFRDKLGIKEERGEYKFPEIPVSTDEILKMKLDEILPMKDVNDELTVARARRRLSIHWVGGIVEKLRFLNKEYGDPWKKLYLEGNGGVGIGDKTILVIKASFIHFGLCDSEGNLKT